MKFRSALAVSLLAVACSSVHPVAIQNGDRCWRCHRTITDPKVAAELIDVNNAPFPFRSSNCLATYLKEHPAEKGTAYVTDFSTGHFLEARNAWFVPTQLPSGDGRTTEADYLAFRSKSDAEAANTSKQPLRRWTDLVAAAE